MYEFTKSSRANTVTAGQPKAEWCRQKATNKPWKTVLAVSIHLVAESSTSPKNSEVQYIFREKDHREIGKEPSKLPIDCQHYNFHFLSGHTDLPAHSDTLGTRKTVTVTKGPFTVSLYPNIFYYKKGQLGNQKSVIVTRWLYSFTVTGVTGSGQVCTCTIFLTRQKWTCSEVVNPAISKKYTYLLLNRAPFNLLQDPQDNP